MSRNEEALRFCGVDRWHKAGYTGKRGLSATGERFDPKGTLLDGWVDDPFCGQYTQNLDDAHAYHTAYIHHVFAPGRKMVMLPYRFSEFQKYSVDYIKTRDVDCMFLSVSSDTNGRQFDPFLLDLPHLSYFSAAGNDGTGRFNQLLLAEGIYGVGAIEVPSLKIPSYTSEADDVDFCAPTALTVDFVNGVTYTFNGTSCSTPALCGMAACVNDFFLEKTGKPLTKTQMYQFFKDCAKDVGAQGKDPKCGWGIPVLPDPATVDIEQYIGGTHAMFSDIQNHWAKEYIEKAAKDGVVNGFSDGTFRPDEPLTRAQFCKIYCESKKEG